jgi:hypothetical protein
VEILTEKGDGRRFMRNRGPMTRIDAHAAGIVEDGRRTTEDGKHLRSSNCWIKVVPVWIGFFDQADLPAARLFFQPLLASNGKFDVAELLKINQPAYTIFFRKTLNRLRSMFVDAPN